MAMTSNYFTGAGREIHYTDWEGRGRGTVIALHLTGLDRNGDPWWWGEPLVVEARGARLLLPEDAR